MFICMFCQREGKNKNSHINHERMCKFNLNRKPPQRAFAGKTPWNKGQTKESNAIIDAQRKKISFTMKQLILDGKHTGCFTSAYWTPERRKEKSEEKKRLYLEFPEKHPNRKLAGNRTKMTYPEKVAFDWLTKNNIAFEHQPTVILKDKRIFPDFKIGFLLIEIDGKYWHKPELDLIRDAELKEIGFDVKRIQASDNIEISIDQILRDQKIFPVAVAAQPSGCGSFFGDPQYGQVSQE